MPADKGGCRNEVTGVYYDVEGTVQVAEKILLPAESSAASAGATSYEVV